MDLQAQASHAAPERSFFSQELSSWATMIAFSPNLSPSLLPTWPLKFVFHEATREIGANLITSSPLLRVL